MIHVTQGLQMAIASAELEHDDLMHLQSEVDEIASLRLVTPYVRYQSDEELREVLTSWLTPRKDPDTGEVNVPWAFTGRSMEGIATDWRLMTETPHEGIDQFLRAMDALRAEQSKPLWERTYHTEEFLHSVSDNTFVQYMVDDVMDPLHWEAPSVTHVALLQGALRIATDRWDSAPVIDPYTGNPLLFDETRIWSLGPDRTDQRGAEDSDDIVMMRF